MRRRFRQDVAPEDVPAELLPGQSLELLETLHLLDRTGRLHADARRKLKQINHLVRLLTPAMEDVLMRHKEPVVVDAGAGNAYLGFVLHEVFISPAGRGGIIAVEPRPDLAKRVRERASALSCRRLEMLETELSTASLPDRVHVLLALHACDTATDDALLTALEHRADHIALVPCCQAEVARQLPKGESADSALGALWRHKWHRREFGAHVTNVIRALTLESFGYQVTVTELVGWEHSMKNELILGRKVHRESRRAKRTLQSLLALLPEVRPKIVRDLGLS